MVLSLSTWLFVIGLGSLNLAASLFIIYRFRLLSEVQELRAERKMLQRTVKALRQNEAGFLRDIVAGIAATLEGSIGNIAAAAATDEAPTMTECPDCKAWVPAGLAFCPECGAKLE